MKRRIFSLLSAIITAALFLSCILSTDDDEIRLISPRDGAILDVDDLSKDTCFYSGGGDSSYQISVIVLLRWEACIDTAIDRYEIEVYDTDSNEVFGWESFPADSTLCYTFYICEEIGHVGEDGSLIPDTTQSSIWQGNWMPRLFPQSYDWRVDGCISVEAAAPTWRIAESEIWSFTVVED